MLNRTLRFTEPELYEKSGSSPNSSSLSLVLNEMLENAYLERWIALHNAKAFMETYAIPLYFA